MVSFLEGEMKKALRDTLTRAALSGLLSTTANKLIGLWDYFQIETHNFKFAKHVSDDRHPSSVVNTSEPLVGVI